MLRPGFGLKDAPRLWHLRCDAVMRELGTHTQISDAQLYARWTPNVKPSIDSLELVCTKHVDDVTGASTEKAFDKLCADLQKHFGELLIQKR